MAGDEGVGKSSAAEGQPSGTSVPVFISYASLDADTAKIVCQTLESHGVPCWIAPRDVKPGAQYADAIVHAINDAKAILLVMSAGAVASAHVSREVERAASKRKPIIVFRMDAAPLSAALEYFLSQSQWMDVPALGMKAALAKLTEAVGQPSTNSSPVKAADSYSGSKKRIAITATVVAVLGVLAAVGLYFCKANHGATRAPSIAAITDKSIAVLPFVDMSEKKDQEYFADGMAEEIIDLLVKYRSLKVISRTSSFQFKGQNEDLRTIGAKLGVAYVLEGSVRRSNDHLRVTAQLINAQNGAHLWSQTYDRDLGDVLQMQDEIASQVGLALQIEVNNALVSRSGLRSTEAYTLFLRGIHAYSRADQQGLEQAATYFQRALDLDPTFADAAVGMSAAYDNLGESYFMQPPAAFEEARRTARQALELEPKNALAHALLGNIHLIYDWDWAAAHDEIEQARNLSPNDASIFLMAAQHSRIVGRWDEALNLMNASVELDPLNPSGHEILHFIQVGRGRLTEAEAAIRRTLEISPTYSFAHYSLGVVLVARGQGEAALKEFLKEPDERTRVIGSAIAKFALGAKADAAKALAQWMKGAANDFPYSTATIFAFRGELDEAFKWLDRAYAQKDARLPFIKGESLLKNLEADPRYTAFLKKMNLPE